MTRRPATPVLAALALLACLAAAQILHGLVTAPWQADRLQAERRLAAALGLSDLALFTEARYSRHPALADLATAFQDAPGSPDHFPSGSLIAPPDPQARTALSFDPQALR